MEKIKQDQNSEGLGELNQVYSTNQQNQGESRVLLGKAEAIPFLDSALMQVSTRYDDIAKDVDALMTDPRYAIYKGIAKLSGSKKIHGFSAKDSVVHKLTSGVLKLIDPIPEKLSREFKSTLASKIPIIKESLEDTYLESRDKSSNQDKLNTQKIANLSESQINIIENKDLQIKIGLDRGGRGTELSVFYNEYEKILNKDAEVIYWDSDHEITAPFQGRKSLEGFSLDSQHLWDISLEVFNDESEGVISVLPPVPTPYGKTPWVPFLEWTFKDKTYSGFEIPLPMDLGNLSIPFNISKQLNITTTVVDDQFGTWFRYFKDCMKCSVNPDKMIAAPYKNTTFLFTLYILNPGLQLRYIRKLLVLIDSFEESYEGTEDPAVYTFPLGFKIVGELEDDKSIQPLKGQVKL